MIGNTPKFLSYEAGTSVLHRLDPRTKLLGTALIVADALIATVPFGMLTAYILGAVAGLMAKHLLPDLWRTLRPLLVLIMLFGVILVVITPGHALAHIWILVPTRDGIYLAIRLGLQALLIVYTTSLLSLTTPPLAVADALHWALGWMERFRVPIRDIIAMVAIGLTFVPLLIEETQKVIAAQRARGADLGMNALLDEQAMAALLIPLLLANLRRGGELAESMESRLYDTGPRTALRQFQFHEMDAGAAAILVTSTALITGLGFFVPSLS
ncbi:MAG TPA: energy-coupling factor transporter transmembrane protein EcfT [Chloroflexota bacterium]